MSLVQINRTQPLNETNVHNTLKEISKYILYSWGYTSIGTEIDDMQGTLESVKAKQRIDIAGIKITSKIEPYNDSNNYYIDIEGRQFDFYKNIYTYDIKGIEAKATLSDFKNGFCTATKYTYIIAPKNTIPLNLIPDKIGFIEADIDNCKVIINSAGQIIKIEGIEIIKKARKRLDARFQGDEQYYQDWTNDILMKLIKQNTKELLFWNNKIPIYQEEYV